MSADYGDDDDDEITILRANPHLVLFSSAGSKGLYFVYSHLNPSSLMKGQTGGLTMAQRLKLVFNNNNGCHCTLSGIDLMIFATAYRCKEKFDTPCKMFGFNAYVKIFRF